MGKHKFLTNDKSNKSDGRDHGAPKSKNSGGRHNKFKNRNKSYSNFNAKPQESTPWLKLKEAFLEQEKEIEEKKKRSHENQTEKDTFLDERNKNYKKFLIREKQKEETSWEDFSSESPNTDDKQYKEQGTSESFRGTRNSLNPEQLSENAKQHFKRVITKTALSSKGFTFESCLKDLKSNGVKRKNI